MGSLAHERGGLWVEGVARRAARASTTSSTLARRRGPRRRRRRAPPLGRGLRAGVAACGPSATRASPASPRASSAPEHSLHEAGHVRAGQGAASSSAWSCRAPYGAVIDPERGEEGGRWAHGFFVSFAGTIAGGTSEIQRNIIASRVLGLPQELSAWTSRSPTSRSCCGDTARHAARRASARRRWCGRTSTTRPRPTRCGATSREFGGARRRAARRPLPVPRGGRRRGRARAVLRDRRAVRAAARGGRRRARRRRVDGEVTGTVALAGRDGDWRAERRHGQDVRARGRPRRPGRRRAATGPTVRGRRRRRPCGRSQTLDLTRRCLRGRPWPRASAAGPLGRRRARRPSSTRATVALAAEMVRHGPVAARHDASPTPRSGCSSTCPIGSFQAIQHKLADMALDLERAVERGATTRRWRSTPTTPTATAPCTSPRRRPATRPRACAKDGIQIHGGIGYTWEHDLHLYLRRAYALRAPARHRRLAPRPPRRPAVLTLRGTQEGPARRARPRRPARSAPRRSTPRARRAPPARPRA